MNDCTYHFCARRLDNDATEEHNGFCESRTVVSELPYMLHGREPKCRTCGRVIVVTYGFSGNAVLDKEGRTIPNGSRSAS